MHPFLGRLIIAALAWLVFGGEQANLLQAAENQAPEAPKSPAVKWAKELSAFDAADQSNPPPTGANLFVGSSSFRIWTNMASCFPGKKVINRGFGGSHMDDSVALMERLVIRYQPKVVLVYAGDNDLAAGKSPERVLKDFQAFTAGLKARLPDSKIVFVSVKPSPSRWSLIDKIRETNRLVSEYAATQQGVKFLDVFTAMLGEDGKPKPGIFKRDKLHMNDEGYKIWAPLIAPYLE